MSQSPKSHSFDRVATDALKAIFPKTWLFKSPRDVDSGREYGEDWIIEIVDDSERPTGAEFSVQNKTNPRVGEQFVSVAGVKLSTLRRLIGLRRPVLLHAYDDVNKVSYWLWLDEWYTTNHKPEWQKQRTITVNVPKANVLNKEAVNAIQDRVRWDHRKRKFEKIAELITETSKDYKIDVLTDENSITTVINARHEGAIPTVRPLDEAANSAMMYALQTGRAVQIPGRIAIEGTPSLLAEETGNTLVNAFIFPILTGETLPLRIEYLDENDQVVFSTPFVMMRLVEPGTIRRRWEGKVDDQHVTYSITENSAQKTQEFAVRFECSSQDATVLSKFFETLDGIVPTRKFKLVKLQNDDTVVHDAGEFFKPPSSLQATVSRRLVKSILSIEHELGLKFEVPRKITDEIFWAAEGIAHILATGQKVLDSYEIVPEGHSLIATKSPGEVQVLMNAFEELEYINLYLEPTEEMDVEFLGDVLKLGPARYEFGNCKIIGIERLKNILADENLAEDAEVTMPFEVDRANVHLKFLNWPRESEEVATNKSDE